MRDQDWGIKIEGSRFEASRLRNQDWVIKIEGLRLRNQDSVIKIEGSRLRDQDWGIKIQGSKTEGSKFLLFEIPIYLNCKLLSYNIVRLIFIGYIQCLLFIVCYKTNTIIHYTIKTVVYCRAGKDFLLQILDDLSWRKQDFSSSSSLLELTTKQLTNGYVYSANVGCCFLKNNCV